MLHLFLKRLLFICFLFFPTIIYAQCPKGINDCKGHCPKFIDANNDGYCDLTTITKIVNKQLEKLQDTLSITKEHHFILKNNYPNTIKKKIDKKVDSTINNNLTKNDKIVENKQIQSLPTISTVEDNKSKQKQNYGYDLIFVSLLTFGLYFTTFFLAKLGRIKKKTHRKIWNMMLLFTFLISCLFGLFLVLQINYHFLYSIFSTLLYWHVEIGISMTLIAVFHILWHLKYFKNYFKNNTSDENCQ